MPRNKQSATQYESKFLREDPAPNWRTRIHHTRLVSQASTVLQQRHPKFWASLLKPFKLSSNLSPSLFHQILNRIRTQPKLCFDFFNWATKNLGFKPDVAARSELTRILFGSHLSNLGKPILNSIVLEYPPPKIVSLFRQRRDSDVRSISPVLNSAIECYCREQLYFQGLEFYRIVRGNGVRLSVDECNRLLNLLVDRNELSLAWCFYASMIRDGVSVNESTWSVIAKILYKDGKFERIGRIFDVGVYTREMFDFMIDGYCQRGDFVAAFDYLEKLYSKGMKPGFGTYASILDGACRYGNREVIENVLSVMVETGHISNNPASGYNLIIKKLCGEGKTFAVDLFFRRARNDNVELENATYECTFAALLREESRIDDAIELYNILQLKKIPVSESCYSEFVIALCKQSPSLRISNLLVDVIRSGIIFKSPAKELSDFINKQCEERHWREAEELLYLILDRGWLLDPPCYSSFVKRYCLTGQTDRAISLHDKLEEMEGSLETATYNVFVSALFRERRVEEAVRVFDYMKGCKRVDSESFEVMIRELCKEKEMRKAMKCHDQMLELGLKPDLRTYKRLIAGFR